MKIRPAQSSLLALLVCFIAAAAWLLISGPGNPIALLRVVDKAGKPIAGAAIYPQGLRTKPGPYISGWYSWRGSCNKVPDSPVTTDVQGYARVPYPKYVFERIETGTLCLSVEHPHFVPERPECRVAFIPPARAPWRVWLDYIIGRIRARVLITAPDPIVLQEGAVLRVSVKPRMGPPHGSALTAQVTDLGWDTTNFWLHPAPDELMTRRLRPGTTVIRPVQFDTNGLAWFGEVTSFSAIAGQTNELLVQLKPGSSVRGQLDQSVPRPIRDGRLIANVWPKNVLPSSSPPEWHAWTNIVADGSFQLASMPDGDLELVAVCDGFVSTNGPGKTHMHYPQKFSLDGRDLEVVLGMEPTASLAVTGLDDQGNPIPKACVSAWPNVRYGEWAATLIGEDRYNTADFLRNPDQAETLRKTWLKPPFRFMATTDLSGFALIRNLPREADVFAVEHERFALPAVDTGFGQKRRQSAMALSPGQTNQVTVRLEPAAKSPIAHY